MRDRNDKRRSPRSKHDSVLELFDTSGHLIIGIGKLVDISDTGACFSARQVLDKDQPLRARIRLLKKGILIASARIVWSRKKVNTYHYGIEFKSIHPTRRSTD